MPKYDNLLDINGILNDYSEDIQEDISKNAQLIAQKGVKALKETTNTYKVRTGKYNRGWKVNTKKGKGFCNSTIHNSTNWQLTHLLEKGHRIVGRNGQIKGKSKEYVHIQPVEQMCIKEFEKSIEQIIKNGG